MLTGKRAFEGEDLTETLASVVKSDPDLTPIPQKLRRLLKKCLEKDPKKRLRDIGDAWEYLDEPVGQTPTSAREPRSRLPWIAAAAVFCPYRPWARPSRLASCHANRDRSHRAIDNGNRARRSAGQQRVQRRSP